MNESDSKFEDDNNNSFDNEDLFDKNENKIQVKDLIKDFKNIINHHFHRFMTILKKYKVINEDNISNRE